MISPFFLRQLLAFQVGAHFSRTLIQNSESVWISTGSLSVSLMASINAVASILILVVFGFEPSLTGFLVFASITAQPPGPGLGSALPSVHRIFMILLYIKNRL